MEGLGPIDWATVAAYFLLVFGLSWYVIRKNKDTPDDYFLAGRNLGWFIIGASIFASNIGSEHLVGLAGSGATDGVAMAHYELHAWCLLVLGWVFVPFYMRSRVFTMPQFLEKRFSPMARWVLSVISLVAYVLTKIAVAIFAGGIVFSVLLPEVRFMGMDSFWIGSILIIVLTGAYTVLGGLRAVAYTDTLQTFTLVIGSALVTIFGLHALGGWSELREIAGSEMFNLWKPLVPAGVEGTWAPVMETGADGEVVRQAWYFNSNYPWLGMLFCAPIIGLWYWCTDQYIVQRALGAPNEQQARRGSLWAGFLKLLPVFIFIIPGMICFALIAKSQTGNTDVSFEKMLANQDVLQHPEIRQRYEEFVVVQEDGSRRVSLEQVREQAPDRVEELMRDIRAKRQETLLAEYEAFVVTEDGRRRLDLERMAAEAPDRFKALRADVKDTFADSGMSFPMMVATVLPVGVRGLVVAGLLAALMSSLSSVFNASATLFTMDFYSRLHPNVSEHKLVWIGRLATIAMVVIGLAWIPVIRGQKGLYDYLQSVQSYLAPPIFVVFFLGVFFKRLNAKGCLAALVVGFLLGLFRLAVDTPVTLELWGLQKHTGYTHGSFLWIVNNMFFQYYSLVIFLVCIGVMVGVSYLTNPPPYEKLSGLTYATLTDQDRRESRASWNWRDVLISALVLLIILAAYLYFNG
ncbi:MAG: sodium:solute symporter [Phycisphaerae bacterium]